jgi:hypothetical protein
MDSTSADKYEQSLHRDTRFWDAVQMRKTKSKKRRSRKYVSTAHKQFSISDEAGAGDDYNDLDSVRFSAVGSGSPMPVTSPSGISGNVSIYICI